MHLHWLHRYLEDSVRKNLCTKIGCTTCGSTDFRDGALQALRVNARIVAAEFNIVSATALAKALGELVPAEIEEITYQQPVQCLLFAISRSLGEQQIGEILGKSWAAGVLKGMRDHEKSRENERRYHRNRNDPEVVTVQRAEKRRLAQEKHLARLESKKARDRLWREKQNDGAGSG